MYRYDKVKYNDMVLSSFCEIEEIRLPVLPSRNVSTLDIASRDGVIFNGNKYENFEIEIDILIDCDTMDEQKDRLRCLRDCFDVNEPKPFFIDDNRFILAITSSGIDKEPVAFHSYTSTITLLCCEPYFYSTELKLATVEDIGDEKKILVENLGKRPVLPLITVGFATDAYFAQLELEETGQKILVGKYPTLSLPTVSQSTTVLRNTCETTSSWTQSSASIDSNRTVGGTLAVTSDGEGVMIGSLPSGDTTWKGSCYRQNLNSAVDEFKVRCTMRHHSAGINGDPSTNFVSNKQTETEEVISGSKTTYWKVIVSNLHYRTGASTSYKSLGKLSKGLKITDATTVSDSSGNKKRKWLKFTHNGSTVYCCREESGVTYVKKYTEDSTTTVTNTITTENMMVYSPTGKADYYTILRKSPTPESTALTTIKTGTIVRVISSKKHPYSWTNADGETETVYYYKLAKPYNGYEGYIRLTNLVTPENATIEYENSEDFDGADAKMGTCELYGFDANGSQLFSMRLYDDNAYYEHTRPEAKIGGKVVLKSDDAPEPISSNKASGNGEDVTISLGYRPSGQYGGWNEFYGEWILTKQKVNGKYNWTIEVNKIKNGNVIKTQRTTTLSSSDYPTNALSYIVIYIGTNDTLEKSSDMSICDVQVDQLNPSSETTGKNVTYFKAGDILDIDCENHRCYLNDEPCDYLVDIGSRYFEIPAGESEISVYSNDKDIYAGLIYREKWLGED